MDHLLLSVNSNCVVYGSPGEGIVPGGESGVAVSAGVAGDVKPLPPNLYMQLVSLCRAVMVLYSTQCSPRIGLRVV